MSIYQLILYFLYDSAIHYLLGYLVLQFTKHSQTGWKLTVCALIGGVFTVVAPCIEGMMRWCFILIGLLAVSVSLSDTVSVFSILKHLMLYAMVGLCFIGGAFAVVKVGGEAFRPYAPITVCFGILIAVGLVRTAAGLQTKKKLQSLYKVEAEGDEGIYATKGYYDSGNVLYYEGEPVVVISNRFYSALGQEPIGEIAVNSVGGIQNLPLIPLTCKIYYGGKKNMIYHTYAAVSRHVDGRKYDILLHRDMGGNHEPAV